MSKYRILSFDGGGIKGLVELSVMRKIMKEYPDLIEKADLLAGTSTGGIVALCLASGMSVQTTIDMYVENAEGIFKRNWVRLFGLTGAKYKNDGLKKVVNRVFGDTRLGDLGKDVLVSSFDLMCDEGPKRWKPKFFHNFGESVDDSRRVADVALYTSAAPTYFKSVDGYIDGGLMANNPSMAALCQSLDERYGDVNIQDVSLFSMGTGESYFYIGEKEHNFGLLSVGKIVGILLDGTESVPHYQCKTLLQDRYIRVNPIDDQNIQMDDIDQMDALLELGQREPIDRVVEWLHKNW